KVQIEIVVKDRETDTVIEIIKGATKTGRIGDGRIFVLPVERSIRVRTGEEDSED
ncbi:MAG: P-II family nitrogen regulator, partial [Methanoregulaceae archaeon]|nr:P-II family nitrogen regulator [Methanoregulaceae archaeon]